LYGFDDPEMNILPKKRYVYAYSAASYAQTKLKTIFLSIDSIDTLKGRREVQLERLLSRNMFC